METTHTPTAPTAIPEIWSIRDIAGFYRRNIKFVPIGYSIAEDGPITVSRRNAKKVSRILIRVARNLSVMQRPEYVESLLLLAATLLDSRGGELNTQR
jgi:hypothetical protein